MNSYPAHIGILPNQTMILDIAFTGDVTLIATTDGVFCTDGAKNSLKRLEPSAENLNWPAAIGNGKLI